MYCTECGASGAGKFCGECGTPLASKGRQEPTPEPVVPGFDWSQSLDYARVTAVPEVRDRIDRAAAASQRLTGEEFLQVLDAVTQPFTILPASVMAKLVKPLNDRLGYKTGKARAELVAAPPGRVLAALLCALATEGYNLTKVEQKPDLCRLQAAMPPDVWTITGGELSLQVARAAGGATVAAEVVIKGQLYDWGKSSRGLERLFTALKAA